MGTVPRLRSRELDLHEEVKSLSNPRCQRTGESGADLGVSQAILLLFREDDGLLLRALRAGDLALDPSELEGPIGNGLVLALSGLPLLGLLHGWWCGGGGWAGTCEFLASRRDPELEKARRMSTGVENRRRERKRTGA